MENLQVHTVMICTNEDQPAGLKKSQSNPL